MSKTLLRLVPEALDQLKPNGPRPYYEDLASGSFLPGWARLQPPLWREPQSNFIPTIWRYADARVALERAGDYVPMEQTDRRNLIMVNPVEENRYGTTRNLVAAYQMIKPGEVAAAHRHTPNALRLILEGDRNVFTTVNGKRLDMMPGDIVLTPNWHWHSHANQGHETAYWIDFLDVPLVQNLEGMFFDPGNPEVEAVAANQSASHSPLHFSSGEIVARDGLLKDGKPATMIIAKGMMRTIGLELIGVPAGSATAECRVMANNIFAVVGGRGTIFVDGKELGEPVGRGDVVAMPIWRKHRFEAMDDLVLFRVSDAPVYEALGLYRENQ